MRTRVRSAWLLACLLFTACGGSDAPPDRPSRPDGGAVARDEDGDGITDADEGRAESRDSDGDRTPDYLDSDSDDDGLPDALEAGDDSSSTPPIDTDADGTPDFIDTDADGNGVLDALEGDGDGDGDGLADYRDFDNDGDLVRDAMELGDAGEAADSDGDGIQNWRDPDSDGDTILDGHEFGLDTDGDALPDQRDLDSDGDGVPDANEAGDTDVFTVPVDTDMDGTPDFRDTDSDDDGLSDSDEALAGSSPTTGDTDGDGVSDLIEVAASTSPTDATDSPRARGDFVFVVPYMEPPAPPRDTLGFRTNIQFADIYFLFDISGSMAGEIGALRGAVSTLLDDFTCMDSGVACAADADCASPLVCSRLSGTCIENPATGSCLLSTYSGAGYYETNYRNLLSLQPSPAATSAALAIATFGGTENLYRALWGVADPRGASGTPELCATPMPGFVGCPAFRDEAVKIVVAFTDEDSDGTETSMQAADALRAAGIRVIGVWSGTTTATTRAELVNVVRDSGSLDPAGMPLVYNGADATVVPAVSGAIRTIVEGVPIRVTIEATDQPDDAGDALPFIERLEVNVSGGDCTAVSPVEDTNADGFADAFPALRPGTPVCWDVVARENTTVMPTRSPQVFKALLTVRGDGSPLDTRDVYFLVPPTIPMPGGPG